MSFYQDHILPHLIDLTMRQNNLLAYRQRLIPSAEGRVLEIGVGSGLNLPLYTDKVEQVVGIDPSAKLLSMTGRAKQRAVVPVELREGSAETIPLEAKSIDTVVMTWTLCSIPDSGRALGEVRRVLKPNGRLLFVEHGRAPDANVCRWQDRLTPLWKRIGGGCHLNREVGKLIANAGFKIEHMENGYMRGPKPMTFMYEGCARPA